MNNPLEHRFSVRGKVAALIGGGGYLLGEFATALGEAGAKVAVLDARREVAEAKAHALSASGADALGTAVDVTDVASLAKACQHVESKLGPTDILINGAGINAPTPFLDIPLEEWEAILRVHVTGTMLACQVFGKGMVARGKGSILNMSSMSSGPPLSKAFAYSVAKAGVSNLTKNLAREWGQAGVRVNALRPGFFPTDWSKQHFLTPERVKDILRHTPMRRFGNPDELVGAMLWLCSDAASFVTGAEIAVDGGFSAMTI